MLMTSNQTSQNPNFSFFQLLIRSEVIRSVLTILTPIFKFALDLFFFLVLFYTNIKHIFNTHTHINNRHTTYIHIYTHIQTYIYVHTCQALYVIVVQKHSLIQQFKLNTSFYRRN